MTVRSAQSRIQLVLAISALLLLVGVIVAATSLVTMISNAVARPS